MQKKLIAIFITIAALALVGVALSNDTVMLIVHSYVDSFKNDRTQKEFVENFKSIEHPAGTIMVAERDSMGLFGNGNHCDFFVGQIRSYTGAKEELKGAYSASASSVEIWFIDDPEIEYFYAGPFNKLADWGIENDFTKINKIYLVYKLMNLPPNHDFRCH